MGTIEYLHPTGSRSWYSQESSSLRSAGAALKKHSIQNSSLTASPLTDWICDQKDRTARTLHMMLLTHSPGPPLTKSSAHAALYWISEELQYKSDAKPPNPNKLRSCNLNISSLLGRYQSAYPPPP